MSIPGHEIVFHAIGLVEEFRIIGSVAHPSSAAISLKVEAPVPGGFILYKTHIFRASQLAELVALNGRRPLLGALMRLSGIPHAPLGLKGDGWVQVLYPAVSIPNLGSS